MPIGNQIQYTDNVASKIVSFTATASQTTFTITGGYRINAISVYKNGLRLANGVDFTATDGATVILTSGASADDKVVVQVWDDINIGYIDSTPGSFSVGNELSVSGITTVGDIYATGIITATSFAGDGSELTGVAGGKWASNDTGINTTTSVGIGTTNAEGAAHASNSQVLVVGIVTANNLYGALTGNVTGNASGSSGSCTGNAATATALASARDIGGVSFDGTGNINLPGVNQAGDQNTTGTSGGLTGTPSITVQDVTAEYVSIAGTLTYDDVVNVDSVGIVTAGKGVRIPDGGIDIIGITTGLSVSGVATFVGLSTFADGLIVHSGAGLTISGDANFTSALKESCTTSTNTVNVYNVDLINGNVHKFDTNGSGAGTVYITYNGGNNVNTWMATNDTVSVSVIAKPNSAGYINAMQIDGTASGVTVEWSSDSAATPSSGNDGAYDLYAFNIVKTGSAAYLVFASRTKYD